MVEGILVTEAVSMEETSVFIKVEAPEFCGQLTAGWLIFQKETALAEHVCVNSQVLGQLQGFLQIEEAILRKNNVVWMVIAILAFTDKAPLIHQVLV